MQLNSGIMKPKTIIQDRKKFIIYYVMSLHNTSQQQYR